MYFDVVKRKEKTTNLDLCACTVFQN